MSLGIVDATLDSLKYVLTQMGAGHSIVLVVGGAAEVNNCRPDSYVLLFSRRKGFIKLALETGLVFLVLTPLREQVAGPNLGVPLDCIVFFFFALNRVFSFLVLQVLNRTFIHPLM